MRTIRFVLFAGEEEAYSGSLDYLKKHRPELAKMQVVLVHDTGTGRVRGISLQERPECKPIIERQFGLLEELGLFTEKPRINPGKDPGSDHDVFDDAGVPAFTFEQFHAEYGLSHHSQADTMERVRPEDLKQGACVAAILAYDSANMSERFPRKPKKPDKVTR